MKHTKVSKDWEKRFDKMFTGELWLGRPGDEEGEYGDRGELKAFIHSELAKQKAADEFIEDETEALTTFHQDSRVRMNALKILKERYQKQERERIGQEFWKWYNSKAYETCNTREAIEVITGVSDPEK